MVNFHKKQEVGNGESRGWGWWESAGKSGSNLLSCLWNEVMRWEGSPDSDIGGQREQRKI